MCQRWIYQYIRLQTAHKSTSDLSPVTRVSTDPIPAFTADKHSSIMIGRPPASTDCFMPLHYHVNEMSMYKGRGERLVLSSLTTRAGFPFRKPPITQHPRDSLRASASANLPIGFKALSEPHVLAVGDTLTSWPHLFSLPSFYSSYCVQFRQFFHCLYSVFLARNGSAAVIFKKCRSSVALSARPRETH